MDLPLTPCPVLGLTRSSGKSRCKTLLLTLDYAEEKGSVCQPVSCSLHSQASQSGKSVNDSKEIDSQFLWSRSDSLFRNQDRETTSESPLTMICIHQRIGVEENLLMRRKGFPSSSLPPDQRKRSGERDSLSPPQQQFVSLALTLISSLKKEMTATTIT